MNYRNTPPRGSQKAKLSNNNNKQKAFTLAEVLITLVIIGIIAAISVPTLTANYKKKETSARLKKFYSTLSQAVNASRLEKERFVKAGLKNVSGNLLESTFWNNTIGKRMPVTKTNIDYVMNYQVSQRSGGGSRTSTYKNVYALNDGSLIIQAYKGGDGTIFIYYDTNGYSMPNQYNKDIFKFLVQAYDNSDNNIHWTKVCAGDSCIGSTDCSRYSIINSCSSNHPGSCSRAIQCNGWELD
ncbi:MAG: prepilin-type N-terminal cleavage/methylation domain-containing protein [Candidatus Gastranaerophilales bacterium]|nr:prepilin-type N-terminal cleavage/methylation domain-containing protein [Candidatus Gastranaerophilales bacterium]